MKNLYEKTLYVAVCLFFALNCTMAYAQEDVATTVIDLNPILKVVLTILGSVAVVLLFAAWKWLTKKFNVEGIIEDDKIKELLDKHVDDAVQYGINQLEKVDWTTIETKNAIVGHAANYVVTQAPKLLEKSGLTGDQLAARIEAKMLAYDQAPGTWNQTEEQ